MPIVIDIADAQQRRFEAERKAQRAQAAREKYAEQREEERKRCRAAKQRQRRGGSVEPIKRYDAEDYAEEWLFLTAMGVRSDQIIERSRPQRGWFVQHVLPLVTRALCANCGYVFDPQRAHSLTRCSKTCGIQKTEEAWG